MSDENEHPDDPPPEDARPADVTLTNVMNRGREKPMGFFDHLEEMRWMLIKCAVVFVLFASLVGYFLKEFNEVLLWPLDKVKLEYPVDKFPNVNFDLVTTSVVEGFNVLIQMCLLGGLILAAPFMLIFIGRFVSPALNEKELKVVIPICLAAFLLFLGGACFGFFLLVPGALRTSAEINILLHYRMVWTAGSYFSILSWLVLGVGGTFEFPLLIILGVWLGIVSTAFLRKYRRHAIVVIFVMAAVVTPTTDPLNMTMMFLPLYVLYEIAILASVRIEKRRALRNV